MKPGVNRTSIGCGLRVGPRTGIVTVWVATLLPRGEGMGAYLTKLDGLAPAARWGQARAWLLGEPLPFFAELRAERPVLVTPEVTLATRYADCSLILRRHLSFQVDLYKPKQGEYWMAQDETPVHVREKAVMRALLDRDQVPAMRKWIGDTAAARLAAGKGRIDATHGLARAVALSLVEEWFGFEDADRQKLFEWSYWSQQDAFHNQPFDHRPDAVAVIDKRSKGSFMMALYLARLVAKKTIEVKLGAGGDKPVARLLRLKFSGGLSPDFDIKRVIFNVGGLLIGAVETTNHCVVNALAELFRRPDALARAQAAALDPEPTKIDGFVLEALRFNPAFPYFFRTAHREVELAGGTGHEVTVKHGTTVLAVTHSAMQDASVYPHPDTFDETRAQGDGFTFGQGLHECLGKAVGQALVCETVRQVLRQKQLKAAAPIVWQGGVPEQWQLQWAA